MNCVLVGQHSESQVPGRHWVLVRSRASAHEAGAPPLICGLLLGKRASQLYYILANLGQRSTRECSD